MVIGSLTARLLVRESRTLKDKRQVVRSVLDRVRAGFNVSAAEVGTHDDVKVATMKGTAQLSGFVNTKAQKTAAGDIASKVPNVKEVANNITVKE